MRIRARLQRLEKTCPVARGCPACHERRGRHFLADVLRNADGSVTYLADMPEPCPACGIVPEFIIQAMMSTTDEPAVCRADGV